MINLIQIEFRKQKKSVAKWEMGFIYYVINKGGESLFCTVWRRKGKFLSLLSFHLTVEQNHRTEQHVESEFFRQQRRQISGSFRASSVISANLKWPPVPSACVVGRHQSSVSGSPWQRLDSYKHCIILELKATACWWVFPRKPDMMNDDTIIFPLHSFCS